MTGGFICGNRAELVTFVVDRRLSEGGVDGLFHQVDDVTTEREQGRTLLGFDRRSTSLAEALVSALLDVDAAGLTVVSVSYSLLSTFHIAHTSPVT